MSERKAQLSIDGKDKPIELPVYEGSTGPDVVDVRSLVGQGVFTYDPGFASNPSPNFVEIDGISEIEVELNGFTFQDIFLDLNNDAQFAAIINIQNASPKIIKIILKTLIYMLRILSLR